jgi:hypothetical protein
VVVVLLFVVLISLSAFAAVAVAHAVVYSIA